MTERRMVSPAAAGEDAAEASIRPQRLTRFRRPAGGAGEPRRLYRGRAGS